MVEETRGGCHCSEQLDRRPFTTSPLILDNGANTLTMSKGDNDRNKRHHEPQDDANFKMGESNDDDLYDPIIEGEANHLGLDDNFTPDKYF